VEHVRRVMATSRGRAFVSAHYYVEFRSHLLRKGQEELHRFVKNHANNEIRPEPVVDEGK